MGTEICVTNATEGRSVLEGHLSLSEGREGKDSCTEERTCKVIPEDK